MAQGLKFICDVCGDECGGRDKPVIYIVVGSTDNGELAVALKLPTIAWEVLKRGAVPRIDFCPNCAAAAIGQKTMTVEEHDALVKTASV